MYSCIRCRVVQSCLGSIRSRQLPWQTRFECFQRILLWSVHWIYTGRRFPHWWWVHVYFAFLEAKGYALKSNSHRWKLYSMIMIPRFSGTCINFSSSFRSDCGWLIIETRRCDIGGPSIFPDIGTMFGILTLGFPAQRLPQVLHGTTMLRLKAGRLWWITAAEQINQTLLRLNMQHLVLL